jgi:hypothetical protein
LNLVRHRGLVQENRRYLFVLPTSVFKFGQPEMRKHRPPPSKAEDREQRFEKLLASIGISDAANPFDRYPLTRNLEQIERAYARGVAASGKQPDRKLLRRYRAAITKVLTLSETVGYDFLGNEIEKAGWSRQNPDADDGTLESLMADHPREHDAVAALTEHVLDIDHWFKTSGDIYRKRDVRKLVVEPFLQLMVGRETEVSRKRLFDALFDWIGVEKKFRPSSASINSIARELDARASSSESNAKRRTKN